MNGLLCYLMNIWCASSGVIMKHKPTAVILALILSTMLFAPSAFAADLTKLAAGSATSVQGVDASDAGVTTLKKKASSKVSKKDSKAAINTVRAFLKASKTYNTKKMRNLFTEPKKVKGYFFDSDKKTKFMVKYCKRYNKYIEYKDFKVKKVKGGLKVSFKLKKPSCDNVNKEIMNDFTYFVFDYYRKFEKDATEGAAERALYYYMRVNYAASKYYTEAKMNEDYEKEIAAYLAENPDDPELAAFEPEDEYIDNPSAVLEWDWENYQLTLKKKNGKWRIVNRSHRIGSTKGAVWHDVDLANLDFEQSSAIYVNATTDKKYVQDCWKEYDNTLKIFERKYYAPSSLLKR